MQRPRTRVSAPHEWLGQLVDGPLVFAANHHDLRSLRTRSIRYAVYRREQGDGKCVISRLDLFPMGDLISCVVPGREESFQPIFGTTLLRDITQHEQSGLVILILPCLEEAIGRSQGGSISGVR